MADLDIDARLTLIGRVTLLKGALTREDPTMKETTRRELGESDSPIEDELEDAFTRMVERRHPTPAP